MPDNKKIEHGAKKFNERRKKIEEKIQRIADNYEAAQKLKKGRAG